MHAFDLPVSPATATTLDESLTLRRPTVGDQNASFVKTFLARKRIALIASRLGDAHGMRLYFATDTGKAMVHSVDGTSLAAMLPSDNSYRFSHSADEHYSGEASLF